MNDEKALLAALAADPSDHVARCAYADWLEENGKLDDREPGLSYDLRPVWRYNWDFGGHAAPVWDDSPWLLPGPLFELLRGFTSSRAGTSYYASREDALAALHEAVRSLRACALPEAI